jgi:hypothetical protein
VFGNGRLLVEGRSCGPFELHQRSDSKETGPKKNQRPNRKHHFLECSLIRDIKTGTEKNEDFERKGLLN